MPPVPGNDARAVANNLLALARTDQIPVDPLKLMKLTYISHGWTLGLSGQPLFFQDVFAWKHGPVIPDVYHAFKDWGYGPVQRPAMFYDFELNGYRVYQAFLTDHQLDTVRRVWNAYKQFSGPQLSTLTHQPNSPWAEATAGYAPDQIRDIPIPNPIIQKHYRALALRNQAAHGQSGSH